MPSNRYVQTTIRLYLLGQLDGTDRVEFEKRLLTDDHLFDELAAIEDELIDEYLAGHGGKDELEMFEKNFLTTPERLQKLRFARALRRYATANPLEASTQVATPTPQTRNWQQFFSNPYIRSAAFASLLVFAAFGVWRIFIFQSDVDKGLLALNAAYRDQRPLEARITQLNYAPFLRTRSPGQDNANEAQRQLAEYTLLDARNKTPTPTAYHALGNVYLSKKEFDLAIQQFEEALKGDPKNAKIYADLGAAYLERGKAELDRARSEKNSSEGGKGLEDVSRSLENFNRALELRPDLLEARFNRALGFEYQGLPLRAEEEWKEYLKRERNSLWADEAAWRLRLLEEQKTKTSRKTENLLEEFLKAYEHGDDETAWFLIRQHRDGSGGPIENTLIDKYLESTIKKQRDESVKALDILSYAGRLERERAGDLFISDLVQFMRSMSDSQRDSLVAARALLKAGRNSLVQSEPEAAAEHYSKAKAAFEQIGDTGGALYAEYPLGHSYLLQAKSEISLATFQRVVEQSEMRQYKWLMAQALNAIANTQIGLNNYSAALDSSKRSLNLSEQIGDTTGVCKTTNQMAQEYFNLGNYRKSLALHEQSLELAKVNALEPMQVWRNYFLIVMPLNAMGLHSAAIEYSQEALRLAQAMKAPHFICRSHTLLGLMYAGRGDYEEGIRNVDVALELGKGIKSEAAQKESTGYSLLQLGHLYRQVGDYSKSIDNYDRALQLFDQLEDYQAFRYMAHKGKLLACMRLEGCTTVAEEINACLRLFEKYRLKILELSNRESFFDREHTIYDLAIEYEFSRSNSQTAFEYSERARSGSLLDPVSNKAPPSAGEVELDIKYDSANQPLGFEKIKAGLPPGTQIAQYAVLNDRLLVWLISETDFTPKERLIPQAELNNKVRAYLSLISTPSEDNLDEIKRNGMGLYDILIKPIEAFLKKDKLLCIVPDKTLNFLPFGALVSTHSGKYLVEEYKIILAPSSTMFIHSSDPARQKKAAPERLLAVGDPRFSREQFPLLLALPSAAKEAQEIKNNYGKAWSVLIGPKATKSLVKAEMKRANVVHFAGHSIVDEDIPLRSKLILAVDENLPPSKENDGVLYAYEIDQSSLRLANLVILSACETGIGRYYRGEGMMGLSRTFLAAGVPLVIGSLWRVDSDSTGDLMIAFHRNRTSGNLSSAEALQGAQLALVNGPDRRFRHPYYWAAFTLSGGSVTF
jgi:CHAT domain-containing protein/Tfp pilus assembly protein PilF